MEFPVSGKIQNFHELPFSHAEKVAKVKVKPKTMDFWALNPRRKVSVHFPTILKPVKRMEIILQQFPTNKKLSFG